MEEDSAILRISRAAKRFENSDNAFELRVPELRLQHGRAYVVVGRSGCGKTTLLDALGLLSKWTKCAVHTLLPEDGRVMDMLRTGAYGHADIRRQYIGYILQQGGLLPFLTAWENIMFPLHLAGKKHLNRRAQEIADRLGIGEQLTMFPHALSIGQRQRVCITRALALQPALILADEPTGALDPAVAADVRDLLFEVAREQGSTVVVVTHDVDLFRGQADELLGFILKRSDGMTVSTLCVQTGKEVMA